MKEYNVHIGQIGFYSNWRNNIFRAVSQGIRYSIRCTTQDQLNYCIQILQQVNSSALSRDVQKTPCFIRWFDASSIGDIVLSQDASAAGEYREFYQVFEEVSEVGTGLSLELPDESLSLVSKRLDGHVITL